MDFTDIDDVHQDIVEKKSRKQSHLERNAEKEIVVEIATPVGNKDACDAGVGDFILEKVNLGKSTCQNDMNLLDVATISIKERVAKDGEDKAALKAENLQMRKYISTLLHGTPSIEAWPPQAMEASKSRINWLLTGNI